MTLCITNDSSSSYLDRGHDGIRQLPWATILCSMVALIAFAAPGLNTILEYQREQVLSGQLWRLLTCHLPHFGGEHLFWDLAVFAVLGAYCERRSLRCWLAVVVGTGILIPLVLLVAQADLASYRGLSGLDTALFAVLTTSWIVSHWRMGERAYAWTGMLLLAGLLGKTLFEVLTGQCLFVDVSNAGFVPVPTAHLVGALVGSCVGMMGCAMFVPHVT